MKKYTHDALMDKGPRKSNLNFRVINRVTDLPLMQKIRPSPLLCRVAACWIYNGLSAWYIFLLYFKLSGNLHLKKGCFNNGLVVLLWDR